MLTRIKFNEIKGQKTDAMVSKEEMVEFLKEKGGSLNKVDTCLILKKYWDVEVDDIVAVMGSSYPDRSKVVPLHGDKEFGMFRVCGIGGGYSLNIDINCDPGKSYSGGVSSGIFCFFIDAEISVIKGGL